MSTTKIKFEIKNRFTGKILFEYEKENNTLRDTVLKAIESKADLSWADLSKADLSWANLSWANLSEANLSEANLSKANLSWANLSEADLSWANLSEANLSEANLSEANLSKADLSVIKHHFFFILLHSQHEVEGLRQKLVEGKVNGTCYEGACCCLLGSIANIRGAKYTDLSGLTPDGGSPAERWFLAIREGDTPEKSAIAKITVEWIDEFLQLVNVVSNEV